MKERLFTLPEVAEMTGYSLHSILQDIAAGDVKCQRRGGRKRVHKRMTPAEVEALRQFRTIKAAGPPAQSDFEAVIAATRADQRRAPRRRVA